MDDFIKSNGRFITVLEYLNRVWVRLQSYMHEWISKYIMTCYKF